MLLGQIVISSFLWTARVLLSVSCTPCREMSFQHILELNQHICARSPGRQWGTALPSSSHSPANISLVSPESPTKLLLQSACSANGISVIRKDFLISNQFCIRGPILGGMSFVLRENGINSGTPKADFWVCWQISVYAKSGHKIGSRALGKASLRLMCFLCNLCVSFHITTQGYGLLLESTAKCAVESSRVCEVWEFNKTQASPHYSTHSWTGGFPWYLVDWCVMLFIF